MNNNIDFSSLKLKIPTLIFKMDLEKQKDIFEYLSQLNEIEKKAYNIAIDHLETSFNIHKSNGFKEWKQRK